MQNRISNADLHELEDRLVSMIKRDIAEELQVSAVEFPAVTIVGPRQSGKTTLARSAFPNHRYISLEDPDVRL